MNFTLGQKFWVAFLDEETKNVKLSCGHSEEKTVGKKYAMEECQILGKYEILNKTPQYDVYPAQWGWVTNPHFKNDRKGAMRFFDKQECLKFIKEKNKKLK